MLRSGGLFGWDGVVLIDNNQMLWEMASEVEGGECAQVFAFPMMSLTLRRSEVLRAKENLEVETDNLVNYPSECNENRIKKVLQIQFPHHTLTLTDLIDLDFRPHLQTPLLPTLTLPSAVLASQPGALGKKLVLFRSKLTREVAQLRGDKKNIAKNVITAFLNFLREGCESQVGALRALIDRTKFNNHLVSLVVANDDLRPFFRAFLASNAPTWVQQSKLKNKDIHVQAIELYQRLCEERDSRARECELKERQRMSAENDDDQYYFQSNINHELEDEIKDFK